MRATRRAIPAVLTIALTGAAVAACGPTDKAEQVASTISPKLQLRQASHALAAQRATTTTLTVKGAPAAVATLAAEGRKAGTGASPVSDQTVQALTSSSIAVTFDAGPDKQSTTDDTMALNARYAAGDLLEVRMVNRDVFLHLSTTTLLAKHPNLKTGLDQAKEQASTVPGADQLLDGQWVRVSAADLTRLTQRAGADNGATLTPQAQAKVAEQVKSAMTTLVEKSDVTAQGDAKNTHLVASVKAADVATELSTLMDHLAKEVPALAGGKAELDKAKEDLATGTLPGGRVDLDFWVSDGKLSAVELDLAQFETKRSGRVALRLDFAAAKPVTAPTGATRLDLRPVLDSMPTTATAG